MGILARMRLRELMRHPLAEREERDTARSRLWMRALAVIAFAGILALCAYGLSAIDLRGALAALAGADPNALAGAVVLYALAQSTSGLMWWVCQRSGGVRGLGVRDALSIHWVARASCELLPSNMGEAARIGLVHRHPSGRRVGLWRITGALAGYKMVDAAMTCVALVAIVCFVPMPAGVDTLARWAALALALVGGGAASYWRIARARGWAIPCPASARARAHTLAEGAGVFRDPRRLLGASALCAGAIGLRLGSLAMLCAAFGVGAGAAALIYTMITLVGLVPGTPGGAGMREAALIPALGAGYGVGSGQALALSVGVQALSLGTSLAIGAIILALAGARLLGQHHDPQAAAEPPGAPQVAVSDQPASSIAM